MRVESGGRSRDNPRFFELIENAPGNEGGQSPSVFAWPELADFLKVAAQPVAGRLLRDGGDDAKAVLAEGLQHHLFLGRVLGKVKS